MTAADDDVVAVALSRLGIAASELPPEILRVIADHLLAGAPTDEPEPSSMNMLLRSGRRQTPAPITSTSETDTDRLDRLRREVGRDLDLPAELAAVLRGDDYDALADDAHRLVDLLSDVEPPVTSTTVPSGPRGTHYEPTGSEAVNAAIRQAAGVPPATF